MLTKAKCWLIGQLTYVQMKSFHISSQTNDSGHVTSSQAFLEWQWRSTARETGAWPHWLLFLPGGRGRSLPSSLMSSRQPVGLNITDWNLNYSGYLPPVYLRKLHYTCYTDRDLLIKVFLRRNPKDTFEQFHGSFGRSSFCSIVQSLASCF